MDRAQDEGADGAIEQVLARADREWRAMGVVAADRAALTDDLRAELTGAAADGVPPGRLIGDDVATFARDLATGAGVTCVPYGYRHVLLTALAGAAPGLALAWLFIWRWWWVPIPLDPDSPTQVIVRYAGSAAVVFLGALYAVRRQGRDDPAAGRTVAAMAVLVPVAGVVAVPLTMGFAAAVGYSTALPVLVLEAAIVAGTLAGAIALARRWALAPTLGPALTR
jgi:hypothetical protein